MSPAGPGACTLRGHPYRAVGQWRGLPVLATASTDSMLRDAAALAAPAVLATGETRAPATAEAAWPAPPGNVYLALPVPPALPTAVLGRGLLRWWAEAGPAAWTPALSWEGGFGALRAPDGRFVGGLVHAALDGGRTMLGLDLHLRGRYRPDSGHVGLVTVLPGWDPGPVASVRAALLSAWDGALPPGVATGWGPATQAR